MFSIVYVQIVSAIVIGNSFIWLLCSYDILTVCLLSTSFLAQDAPDSYIPCLSLQSAISPGGLCFYYWKMVFRNQDLDVVCPHNYWGVIASRPPPKLGSNICVI